LSAIPAIVVAFSSSPTTALIVAVAYLFIQIAENNVLVPRIMQRAVGLNPLVVILAVITGGELLGVVGALLSVPLVSLGTVIYSSIQKAA
jgi:predicted PurR-regulated permease PerM